MESTLTIIGALLAGILLGGMVFFSAVMAPLIFTKLAPDVAGGFIRQVFPWYYLYIILVSGLAALAVLVLSPANGALLACIAVAGVLARQLLMPLINRQRDAVLGGETAAEARFTRLHRLSVEINAAQIIAVGIVLARLIPLPT